jgi:hypothetical protein
MTNAKFRKQLKIDFTDAQGNLIFNTIEELKTLMRRKGYRRKSTYKYKRKYTTEENPTQKQLAGAWEYLKAIEPQQYLIDDFITETYKTRTVYRAKREILIDGKRYKRGQFLPKRSK